MYVNICWSIKNVISVCTTQHRHDNVYSLLQQHSNMILIRSRKHLIYSRDCCFRLHWCGTRGERCFLHVRLGETAADTRSVRRRTWQRWHFLNMFTWEWVGCNKEEKERMLWVKTGWENICIFLYGKILYYVEMQRSEIALSTSFITLTRLMFNEDAWRR